MLPFCGEHHITAYQWQPGHALAKTTGNQQQGMAEGTRLTG
ncbi:hypothetical protein [Erwinia mallotivora]|nr:hypothetical protein [Erwinia mallotivora]